MNFLQTVRERFAVALAGFCEDVTPYVALVRPAQDAKFGDYQANFAMSLGKLKGINPRELASQVVARLDVADLCDTPEIAGPGFINLRIRADRLGHETNRLIGDPRLGISPVRPRQTYVVDFSGPNVAKPMHVGHLRSTVIGDCLCRVLRFAGHKVLGDNHIGDWGTQFGMIIYGYKHFLDADAFRQAPVLELARLYRLVNQLCDYHELVAELPRRKAALLEQQQQLQQLEAAPVPADKKEQDARKKHLRKLQTDLKELQDEVAAGEKKRAAIDNSPALKALADGHPRIVIDSREETAKLHAGDAENTRLWQEFVPACLAAIQGVYDRLGIKFDLTLGESYYQPMLADVVTDLQNRGLAVESEGAMCVFNPGIEAPFLVRKRDGAYTYATTDLATIKYRVETLQAHVALYVVDARQGEHFQSLFATARRWGYDQLTLKHVSFGTIMGKDGKPYKTRSGDTVGLESLLDEGVSKALGIVSSNDDAKPDGPELDAESRARIAEVVGIGAIKYADLCQNRETDYIYDEDKMLATRGNTATYMQYAFARVCGIFRKGETQRDQVRQTGGQISLDAPAERALALQLHRFGEALQEVIAESRPNYLTQYLFDTANCFSTFFEQCPVLKAESAELRHSRLLLCDLTATAMEIGLGLLGIQTVEKM